MFKQIITLAVASMLIFAAGCQSQGASEKKAEPAAENEQKPEQNDQAEEPAKEETPDQGTTTEEEPAPEQEEPSAPSEGDTAAETDEPAQDEPAEEPAQEEDTHYVSPFEMRDEISIGLTKEEAESVLQNTQPVEVTTEDGKALRYDYMPQDGYKSAAADPDVEAIKAGKLESQVFIYYTPENTVERFRIYHKTDDGKAIEYRDEGNGEGTETILN
ncbi:hypothetical protein J9317_06895 [Metabacillus sp. KIGAM252]|uniref:Uncharacterized protein n=1 Tax=Metabacillus flavus TaxID=2823519 RepID=A0ABS5LCM1_9BACI|nr:hypothetical protein [Metabacillus flavus]MBS2968484.1 hypothetical protein [Metabacillus flavus]